MNEKQPTPPTTPGGLTVCAYLDCKAPIPATFGAGVARSRVDSKTLICSKCGIREASTPAILATGFKGLPPARFRPLRPTR